MAAIVEIVASFLGPAIELGKCTVAPIKRQFNYLCCFDSNIQSLRDEAKKLDDVRAGLQMQVDAAERNTQVILPEVDSWLKSANQTQINISRIENEIPKAQRANFLNIKSRFSLSKKAKKAAEDTKMLRDGCKFPLISQTALPAAMVSVPLGQTCEFESRKQIEEDIMEALRGKNFNMMGIYGMGGVGKTTMAKKIMNRVREENLFDEVAMAVVSQQIDNLKIQEEIAESLGLDLGEKNLSVRANKLHARLTGSKKRILVVLDDVWEKLNLELIGIPCHERGFQGCTILFTSRNRDGLNQMPVQRVCAMETLTEQEAWLLFREKAGNWLDNSSVNLLSIAKKVAKECEGLPIALVTVGCALKDEKRESVWKNALDQLKNLHAIDMPYVIREVYNPLKLSYEFLENQHAKSLFLLCCLFPEDSNISLDCLTMYSMGLGMFGRITLGLARSRVLGLVEMLKSRSLLLDSRGEHHVKMHDVVRDVAIFIARRKGLIVDANWSTGSSPCGNCKWISMFLEKTSELLDLMRLNFPSLRLLMMSSSFSEDFEIKEEFCFSEGMKELNVLSFEHISLKSIQLQKNLRTLHLECCRLESISVVGEELLDLEILCCRYCYNIKELSVEIGRLKRLKLLEFSECESLKTIAPGIISKLVELEELKIRYSFNSWESTAEADRKETGKNVSLKELESLSNLTRLEIDISDYTLAAEEIRLSSISSIVKYDIQISGGGFLHDYEKCIALELPREIALGSWIHEFLRSTEELILDGDGSNSLDLLQTHKYLKSLKFRSCSTVKKLVDTTSSISIDWRTIGDVLPTLESLDLHKLPNLEEICDGSILERSLNSFKNLKRLSLMDLPALKHLWKSSPNQNINISLTNLDSIYIWNCGKLRNLFSLALIANDALSQLEELEIKDCEIMEEIFSIKENKKDGEDQSHCQIVTFPKLKKLELNNLENLTTFCKGIESIEFPLLAKMDIQDCPKLTSLVSSSSSSTTKGHGHDDNSLHLFCSQRDFIGVFPALQSLQLSKLPNLEEICDGSILEGSPNSFKNLKQLSLMDLPALKHLWKSPNQNIIVSLTNLSSINIKECGKLRNLISLAIANVALLQLEKLRIEDCEMMEEIFSSEELKKKDRGDQSHFQIITFPKLNILELYNLDNLTTFHKRSQSIEFPVLVEMRIIYCPKLTSLVSSSSSSFTGGHDDDESNCHLFRINQKVIQSVFFPMLETLTLVELPNLEKICDDSILEIGSHNSFKNLKKLKLDALPSLKYFWKSGPNQNLVSLTNLSSIKIQNCGKLRNFLSLGIAEDALLQLEELRIIYCEMMEEIFSIQENKKYREDQSPHQQTITFPKLNILVLKKLGNLTTFCKGIESIEFPLLAKMDIRDCSKLTSLVSSSSTTKGHGRDDNSLHLFCSQRDSIGVFHALQSLRLSKLPNLEEICDGSILERSPNSLKNLKQLSLMDLPALKRLWKSSPNQNIIVSLTNLSSINIKECGKLCNLFSLTIANVALLQLKTLRIADCEMMEEIFLSEELNKKNGDDQSHFQIITFPKLKRLVLKNLESLTTLCKGLIESVEFPVLKEMEIQDCPKLTNFDSSNGNNHQNSTDGHGHDGNSLHLFCSQRIAFGSLKHLTIGYYGNNINNIWCRQIPLGFFNILEELEIFDCVGIKSLFSSSISGNFVNLKELSIQGCQEMEKVIEDEDKLCEKSPFPRLEQLTLEDLFNLRSFCKWNRDLELPCLKEVCIKNCSLMENFTMGFVNTPKLDCIKINEDYLEEMIDLNGAIKRWCFKANEDLQISNAHESTSSCSAEGTEEEGERQGEE